MTAKAEKKKKGKVKNEDGFEIAGDLAKCLADGLDELKEKKREVYPVKNNNASQIGFPCLRFQVMRRLLWDKKPPPSLNLQYVFDEGKDQEFLILRDLRALGQEKGFEVEANAQYFEDKKARITGKQDSWIRYKGYIFPIEVKSMSPHTWDGVNTVDDFQKWLWSKKYPGQLTMYLLLTGQEFGLFVLKNKVSGRFKFLPFRLDFEYAEKLLKLAEKANEWVDRGEIPPLEERGEEVEAEDCLRCDFFQECLPDIEVKKKLEFLDAEDEPATVSMLERYEKLKPMKSEFEKLDKAISVRFSGIIEAVVGPFMISGKEVKRKGYVVEDSTYWQKKVSRLVPKSDGREEEEI